MLVVKDLTFAWSKQSEWLFGPLNFSFNKCSITAILGPNGVGKTTLLNIIGDRLSPNSGTVTFDGNHANADNFNYMLQNSERQLFPHLILHDNIYLSRNLNPEGKRFANKAVDLLFADRSILSHYPKYCSGGQQQRAVLCRAIHDISCFPVTLLDEPFAQISQDVKPEVYSLIKESVSKSETIVLVVSHDISEALILADRIVVISSQEPMVFDAQSVIDARSFVDAFQLRDDILKALFQANESQTKRDIKSSEL